MEKNICVPARSLDPAISRSRFLDRYILSSLFEPLTTGLFCRPDFGSQHLSSLFEPLMTGPVFGDRFSLGIYSWPLVTGPSFMEGSILRAYFCRFRPGDFHPAVPAWGAFGRGSSWLCWVARPSTFRWSLPLRGRLYVGTDGRSMRMLCHQVRTRNSHSCECSTAMRE